MLDWIKKANKQEESASGANSASLTIRVIGDRAAGKTTYMASLARWAYADSSSPVQAVEAFNDDGKKLVSQAQDILEQALQLEPTPLAENTGGMEDYGLRIILKQKFSLQNRNLNPAEQSLKLDISCKDYSGEFFTDLLYRQGDPLLDRYINDCLEAEGILFLLDGIARNKDAEYVKGLSKFLDAWGQADKGAKKRRIALVLTKCEQPDLWVNRHKPKELAKARFRQVCTKLETWQQLGKGNVEYFASSAFGMLGSSQLEANVKKIRRDRDGVASVLKDPSVWRPFGLVAPIYWLYKGERHPGLD
jgi:GTPase SAR1 family protein